MGFLGMRGTGDWETDARPKDWRETILYLYPNGDAPLTAILSKLKAERTTDPEFNWWTKNLPSQAAAVTGVYTDAGLSVAYVSGGVSGDTIYFKMAVGGTTSETTDDGVKNFRLGHTVNLMDVSDVTMTVVGKIVGRSENGASSYIAVTLLEDDDNSTSHDLSDCDRAWVIGNVNAEGAGMPNSLSYDSVKWYNYTQIFRTPMEITRTARLTKYRNGDKYNQLKKETLQDHSIEMEKAFLFGVPSEGIGSNGKKERTTLGLVPAIRGGYTGQGGAAATAGSSGTVDDYTTNTKFTGQTWLQGGEEWLDDQLEIIFRYGKLDKLAMCGSGALQAINRLVKSGGDFTFTPKTMDYGIRVIEWVTPHGTINLMTHPLFSMEPTMRYTMVVFEPENIISRDITATTFYDDDEKKNTGYTRVDGIKEEFLTETGLEYHHPIGWAFLSGFGSDA